MKKLSRIASIVALCFLVWLTTTAILAQQRGKAVPPKPVDSMLRTRDIRANLSKKGANQAQPAEPVIAMSHLDDFDLTIDGDQVQVSAKVSMSDRRPGISYIWRLRAMDLQGHTVGDLWYDQQIFQVTKDEVATPTFRDSTRLPAGASRVQITLYEFPTGTDLATLTDEKRSPAFPVARGVKKLTN